MLSVRTSPVAGTSCYSRIMAIPGGDLEALIRKTMAEHQVLPTQVYERLTGARIRS